MITLENIQKEHNSIAPKGQLPRHKNTNKRKLPFKERVKREWDRNAIVYIFLIPALIHFLIFQIIPFAYSFVLTFLDWKIIGDSEFVGLKNWIQFFNDDLAWKAIWNTVLFSIYYILPTMALGLILALIINLKVKFTGFFKGVFFLPVVP